MGKWVPDPGTDNWYSGYARKEGAVVGLFTSTNPEYAEYKKHKDCGNTWQEHGWIDTLEGGHIVCPTDWIITGVRGEYYSIKNNIFLETYEEVTDD